MDQPQIRKLLAQIFDTLEGDWILVGGALLHAMGLSNRQTLDIDLVPMNIVTNRDQLKLMDIAIKNGFPPETINFAAEYFVKKQPRWKKEVILLKETKRARIFRPSRKLFKKLKLARSTEIDLADIAIFEKKVSDP